VGGGGGQKKNSPAGIPRKSAASLTFSRRETGVGCCGHRTDKREKEKNSFLERERRSRVRGKETAHSYQNERGKGKNRDLESRERGKKKKKEEEELEISWKEGAGSCLYKYGERACSVFSLLDPRFRKNRQDQKVVRVEKKEF